MTKGIPNKSLKPLRCPECAAEFVPRTHRQWFCSPAHKDSFWSTLRERGHLAAQLAITWRSGKHRKTKASTYALAQLSAAADLWIAEDKKAGRDPSLIVERKRASGWLAADLA